MAKLVGRDPYEELNDALKVFDRQGDGYIMVKAYGHGWKWLISLAAGA